MESDMNDWRKRLRHAVDLTRRTQCSIAEDAGVTPETFSRVMSGRHVQPGFETVVRIIHAVGETVGWIIREPQASLSADDGARMREIVGFLDELFPPINRDTAVKPSPTLPDVQGHAVLTAIYFEEGGRVTGFVEELHGISAHGKTLREARTRLTQAARAYAQANREGVRQRPASYGTVTRERLIVEI
jgi:transcriptional regulator with XRE-family HTH domain/predicted RNase H-like HicB family nuclease